MGMSNRRAQESPCATIIPAEWSKFTGPEYKRGMSAEEGRKAWNDYLRRVRKLSPTPKVYR